MLSSVEHVKRFITADPALVVSDKHEVSIVWRYRTFCFVKCWLINILSKVSTLMYGELLSFHKIPNNRTYIFTGVMTGVISHSVVYNGNLVSIPKVKTNSKLQNITLNLIFAMY